MEVATFVMPRPPLIQPIRAWARTISRSVTWEAFMIAAARMKNGTASRTKESMPA